jgi:hypothetical protein
VFVSAPSAKFHDLRVDLASTEKSMFQAAAPKLWLVPRCDWSSQVFSMPT